MSSMPTCPHSYVYGGRSSDTALFDQIYVLSLPSFHWTKVCSSGVPWAVPLLMVDRCSAMATVRDMG
jgi:hypothetical protein